MIADYVFDQFTEFIQTTTTIFTVFCTATIANRTDAVFVCIYKSKQEKKKGR